MWRTLAARLAAAEADPTVGVLVLRGAGENFCAGSDVSTLLGGEPLDARMRVSNRCVLAVHESRMPTVAVVDGVAAGAGINLALACDLVVATTRSRFIEVFIRRGLSLDSGGSWLLPRLVGEHRARELAFLGDTVDGERAAAWGLANWAVAPAELDGFVGRLVSRLAAGNPVALAASKRLLRASRASGLADALEAEVAEQFAVISSDQSQQRIAAFGTHGDTSGAKGQP
jgi:2-(1,2-epoxy-1,2-dihydrophenyl)acetyl-CoA isomerase